MKKVFKFLGAVIAMLLLALLVFFYINTRDRHPGYSVDLNIKNESPGDIMVGFAAVKITPQIHDRWVDANNDAKYVPKDGDTFEDLNGNGKFDPIWIAGFSNKRAANGVHDDLWARTVVFDDGKTRISLTSIDAIGFMHDEVVDVREFINPESGITYSVVSSTHTHEAPDLLGLWGESYLKSGVNPEYMDYLKRQTALSIDQAASRLQKASLKFAINENDALSVVMDTRKPYIYDPGLRMIQAVSLESGETLGTLVAWADHPETLWSKNLDITSDFPHFIREGMEKGVYMGDSLIIAGKGGISVYFNGAVGGLMTTHPSLEVKDHFSHEAFKEPGFDKAKAQGDYLAFLALSALDSSNQVVDKAGISLRAKSITLAFQNPYFRLGALLGVLNRGMTGWMKARSEMAAFSIGPAHFVTVPGEIYPEIVNGGVEAPEGQDFVMQPQEVPFIRAQMKGEFNFLFGMANDMVGYIIPKSQWDEEAPFTYGADHAPYGEVNSLGPETAPKVHSEASALLEELYN
jgi:hypothetical protein